MKLSSFWTKSNANRNTKLIRMLIPTTVLMLTLIFITFYGLNTGNFTVSVEQSTYERNISIADKPNSKDNSKTLYVSSRKILPNDFYLIDSKISQEIVNTNGDYLGGSRRTVIGNTFYLKNRSESLTFDVNFFINLREFKSKTDEIKHAKIMIIIDDLVYVFHNEKYNEIIYPSNYIVNNYDGSGKLIGSGVIENLAANSEKKISIIFWFEGSQINNESNDLEENILIEALKLQLTFEIEE